MNDLSGNSETLALSPPNIFGSVSGVKSEDPNVEAPLVGAPLRLTEKGFLEVVVDPPFPAADKLTLHLNDKRIDVPLEVDAQGRTRFRVSRALLREGAQSFHFLAERGSGNPSEPSPKLWVLYSLNRPGGRDPFGGNDYHDSLKIDLPEAIKKLGVGPEEAAQGIPLTVSYPFAKLHDVVEVNCNGYTFTYPVTQNDLGGSFDIPIPEEAFIEGGSSEAFLISYRVWDQLENYTQDGLPSIALSIVVDLKPKEMDRPDLIEDMAGDEDDADTIDRSRLKDFLLARVHVRTPLWKKGDSVRLTYTCVPAEGAPVTRTLADVLVNRVPDFLELKIPAAQVIGAARLIVSYSLARDGVVQASSYATRSEIVGGGSNELPLPFVPGLVGNSIAPTKYPEGFTVRVDWATGWKEGDKAKLVVTRGTSGVGTPVFGFVVFNTNFRANFRLSRDFIMANAGREVVFKWFLLRDGKETESQPLALTVERINATDPNFPSAEIIEANGTDVVDLRLFKGHAQIVVARWPFMALKNLYWLEVVGVDVKGNPLVVEIASAKEVAQEELDNGLNVAFPREKLMLFKHGSKLIVEMKADLYPNENNQTIVHFRAKTYTIMTVAISAPEIISLKNSSGIPIPDKGTTSDTTLTLTGTALNSKKVDVFNRTVSLGPADVNSSGVWTLRVTSLKLGNHEFSAIAQGGNGEKSNVWTVNVIVQKLTTITSVKDSTGREIPEKGATKNWTITLRGTARENATLYIFNGKEKIGEALSDASGGWSRQFPNLRAGLYSFTAKGMESADPESTPPRTMSVIVTVSIDQTPLQLSSALIFMPVPVGVIQQEGPLMKKRSPVGGLAPFTFRSSNPAIAGIDGEWVVAKSNGTVIITVRDALGDEATYTAVVKCNYRCLLRASVSNLSTAVAWIASQSGIGFDQAAVDSLRDNYLFPDLYSYPGGRIWLPGCSIRTNPNLDVGSSGRIHGLVQQSISDADLCYALGIKRI